MAGLTPNVAVTVGAWWPAFGYFEKYDTYTLGRFRQIGEQASPLKRLGIPKDIADVVAFVVSEEARWLTGQNIHAGGGVVM